MNRNDLLQWFILGFGQSGPDDDLGRMTTISQLWHAAKKSCFDCDRYEVLDALYTMPREYATLIKFISAGEGLHPVGFERVRNTVHWPDYFTRGQFSVKVLPEGKAHYESIAEQLGQPLAAASSRVEAMRQAPTATPAPH